MSQDFWQRNLFWVAVAVVIVAAIAGLTIDSVFSGQNKADMYRTCIQQGTSQPDCQKFLYELDHPYTSK